MSEEDDRRESAANAGMFLLGALVVFAVASVLEAARYLLGAR